MNRGSRVLSVVAMVSVLAMLVLRNVDSHAPVQSGTAREFWMVACGIDLDGSMKDFAYSGGVYPPQGDWAVYYIQGYHDQFLHRVRLSGLSPDLPKIESALSDESSNRERRPWLAGYSTVWRRLGDDENEVRRLLSLMRISYLTYSKVLDEESYASAIEDEDYFIQRWQREKSLLGNRFIRVCVAESGARIRSATVDTRVRTRGLGRPSRTNGAIALRAILLWVCSVHVHFGISCGRSFLPLCDRCVSRSPGIRR